MVSLSLSSAYQSLRKSGLCLITTALLWSIASYTYANDFESNSFVVVIKKSDETTKLERKDLRHIFMGTNTNPEFRAVHLPVGHPLRITFNTSVIGLTEARIQSYWAQLRFTGRGKLPLELKSVDEVVSYLQANHFVAAYLPATMDIPEDLIVIYP